MTAVDKARHWLVQGAKTTTLAIVPLAALSAPDDAKAGFDANIVSPTVFQAGTPFFQYNGGSGGFLGAQSGLGTLAFPTLNLVTGFKAYGSTTFTTFNSQNTFDFIATATAGAGSGTFGVASIPISWTFTVGSTNLADLVSYQVFSTINSTNSNSTPQAITLNQATTGSFNALTPPGQSLNSATFDVRFTLSNAGVGDTLTVTIPQSSLNINPAAVPEPSSWQLSLLPLIGLAGWLRRRTLRA